MEKNYNEMPFDKLVVEYGAVRASVETLTAEKNKQTDEAKTLIAQAVSKSDAIKQKRDALAQAQAALIDAEKRVSAEACKPIEQKLNDVNSRLSIALDEAAKIGNVLKRSLFMRPVSSGNRVARGNTPTITAQGPWTLDGVTITLSELEADQVKGRVSLGSDVYAKLVNAGVGDGRARSFINRVRVAAGLARGQNNF